MENFSPEYFNAEWYLQQYPKVEKNLYDPLDHFLNEGWKLGYNPGKDFNIQEYITDNPDILDNNAQILDHINFTIQNMLYFDPLYPEEAITFSETFKPLEKGKKLKRVIVFASTLYGSIVHEHEIYLLKKLKEVSDAIIYISESPILAEEIKKIAPLVNYAECKKHGMYNLGSYKYGIEYLCKNINIEDIDELILCDNSCFAPIFFIRKLIYKMKALKVDCASVTLNNKPIPHLDTYFLLFNNKIIQSKVFLRFFQNIEEKNSYKEFLLNYTFKLYPYLTKHDFNCDTYILSSQPSEFFPCALINSYELSFLKTSYFLTGLKSHDTTEDILETLKIYNPELASLAIAYLNKFDLNRDNWVKYNNSFDIKKLEKYMTFLKQVGEYVVYQSNDEYKKNKEIKFYKQVEIRKTQKPKYYLSVVAIFKNEAPYMKEWLDYHIHMGVEHFYLYDNETTDNTKEILEPYIKNNYVTYTYWPGKLQQEITYNHALKKYRAQNRWLAFIDLDEYICPVEKISITEFLKDYEDYPALSINWLTFDSNGHETMPKGSILENYTRIHKNFSDFHLDRGIKSIVDPMRTEKCEIHSHIHLGSSKAVTENFLELDFRAQPEQQSINKIRVNHYYTKSKEEFIQKMQRGVACFVYKYTLESFDERNFTDSTVHDYTILQHIKKS